MHPGKSFFCGRIRCYPSHGTARKKAVVAMGKVAVHPVGLDSDGLDTPPV